MTHYCLVYVYPFPNTVMNLLKNSVSFFFVFIFWLKCCWIISERLQTPLHDDEDWPWRFGICLLISSAYRSKVSVSGRHLPDSHWTWQDSGEAEPDTLSRAPCWEQGKSTVMMVQRPRHVMHYQHLFLTLTWNPSITLKAFSIWHRFFPLWHRNAVCTGFLAKFK